MMAEEPSCFLSKQCMRGPNFTLFGALKFAQRFWGRVEGDRWLTIQFKKIPSSLGVR